MNDELNKAAHEALGKCWHEWSSESKFPNRKCSKCPVEEYAVAIPHIRPDYCSSLHAARELEMFTIEKVGKAAYWNALQEQFDWPRDGGTEYIDEFEMVTADALTRVKACLEALKQTEEAKR